MIPREVEVVDSHTEGEPTRVVVSGWPEPPGATMAERRESMRREQDALRRAVVLEPHGHDAVVGALLTPPVSEGSAAGVVFFNNVGYLGMCGHGLIGVVQTLAFLSRVSSGTVRLDTPVGTVSAELETDGTVTIANVASRAHALDVAVDVPGHGRVVGDVAWGGNWFFLVHGEEEVVPARIGAMTAKTMAIMEALEGSRVAGADGGKIDHVELFGPPSGPRADSRNFVLCPGAAYDRSPCGTGTSAKMAVLHARGRLAVGARWRQESVTGGLFTGWLTEEGGALIPHVNGRAFVTSRATLLFDPADPFRGGLSAA